MEESEKGLVVILHGKKMIREVCGVLKGSFLWTLLKIRDRLNYKKIVLVLSGENPEVDKYALMYLDYVLERKSAKSVVIYVMNEEMRIFAKDNIQTGYKYKIKRLSEKTIDYIYKRYVFNKFYKNIFWTYVDKTPNNLLGRFMRETDINAEDVVCLAIYNLRQIPKKVMNENVR